MSKVNVFVGGRVQALGQSILEESSTQAYPLGERLILNDGRVFHYCSNGGTALDRGKLIQGQAWHTTFSSLDGDAASVGVSNFEITNGATNAWNHTEASTTTTTLKDGYWLNETDGSIRKIRDFDDTAASTKGTIFTYNEITEAIGDTDDHALMANPWAKCIKCPTTTTGMIIGVPLIDVSASTIGTTYYYFWAQTWGVAPVLADTGVGSPVIGDAITLDTSTSGAIMLKDWDAADENTPGLGYCLSTPTDGEFCFCMLMIHP